MAKSNPAEYEQALSLLRAALGEFDPNQSLKRILPHVPDFGSFEWMLTIIGLEIDLRVDIPEAIADDHSRTAAAFCRSVASLPKIDTPGYTLECLGLVAQALLSLDVSGDNKSVNDRRAPRKASSNGRNPKPAAKSGGASAKSPARSKRTVKSTSSTVAKSPARSKRTVKSTSSTVAKSPARSKRTVKSTSRALSQVASQPAKKTKGLSTATKTKRNQRRA